MFFDIGWPELMLIGVVALVVIGPKDLPRALRVAGMFVRKARTLSREFQSSIDQMIREAELEEMKEELKKATDFNIENEIRTAVDPQGELAGSLTAPDAPDFFVEEEGRVPPETSETPALPAPVEEPLPEQPDLPFGEPHRAEPAAEPVAEPVYSPPKP